MNCCLITIALIAVVMTRGSGAEEEKVEKDDGFIKLGTIHASAAGGRGGAGKNLYLSTNEKNFANAKYACERELFPGGGELVSILSSSIDTEVRNLLIVTGTVGIHVWTSGIAGFDGWEWTSASINTTPFTYKNFAPGQDYPILGQCVAVRASYASSAWYSHECIRQLRFICIY